MVFCIFLMWCVLLFYLLFVVICMVEYGRICYVWKIIFVWKYILRNLRGY